MRLNQSDVVFYENTHTYISSDGKRLSGVTSLLSRQIFKHKYDGISRQVLDNAAKRGSELHEAIEFFDSIGGEADTEELKWYEEMKEKMGLSPLANEYLVSDNDHVASSIDMVYTDLTIADAKSTSKLDKEYLSWQLSIYAYLFEIQNPGLKVKRLLAFWFPKPAYGKRAVVEIERKDVSLVRELILADKEGRQFVSGDAVIKADTQVALPGSDDAIQEVCNIIRDMKEAETRVRQLKDGLLSLMRENNCKSFSNDSLSLTRVEERTQDKFDAKAFEQDHPDLYKQYLRQTTVKESLTIRLK